MAIYLGLDLSTQGLTAIAIEVDGEARRVLFEQALRFDDDLPRYGTKNGVLPGTDLLVVHSSPLLWAESLDLLLGRISGDFPLAELRAIAGSGQQHGSVYIRQGAEPALAALRPNVGLAEQIEPLLSRRTSPVWMDSSTRRQCDEIARAAGGDEALARLTGSRAFERFTGPQIRKFFQEAPEDYRSTGKVHLVSSFLATLLAGRHAAVDPGDASGMNLMDLARRRWASEALAATAPDLELKLPEIRESWHINGTLSRYWVERHGYPAGVRVVSWSGDNPCSLIGVGLVEPGKIAISLGTSDTLFGFMPQPRVDPGGDGHTFGSPTGDYMSLICFKNGSLARERIRSQFGLDWGTFSRALLSAPPGNGGAILLPWFEPEITPNVLSPSARRYGLEPSDAAANVRAVIEAQMMSMALHSRWMGVETHTIHATGGASLNREILGVMADVHDADVYQFPVGNSAALGAALRAFHADRVAAGEPIAWPEVVREFAEPIAESRIRPDPRRVALYGELKEVYSACEAHALRGEGEPLRLIEAFRRRHAASP